MSTVFLRNKKIQTGRRRSAQSKLIEKALLQGVPAAAAAGIKSNPSFTAACTSEMTPLMTEGTTFSPENESLPSCSLTRKCGEATFSTASGGVPQGRPACSYKLISGRIIPEAGGRQPLLQFPRRNVLGRAQLLQAGIEVPQPGVHYAEQDDRVIWKHRRPPMLRDNISPEARSYPGRTGHGSGDGGRTGPPAPRCWTPPGSSPDPAPWSVWR